MTREEIRQRLRGYRAEISGFGVRRLALFGPVARGEETPASDVDLLVAFEGQTTFDRYFDFKFWLEDILGCPVDLVTEKALRPEIASDVKREALHVTP